MPKTMKYYQPHLLPLLPTICCFFIASSSVYRFGSDTPETCTEKSVLQWQNLSHQPQVHRRPSCQGMGSGTSCGSNSA
ncbi:hypothetical protein FF1_034783 [Malus domestica]